MELHRSGRFRAVADSLDRVVVQVDVGDFERRGQRHPFQPSAAPEEPGLHAAQAVGQLHPAQRHAALEGIRAQVGEPLGQVDACEPRAAGKGVVAHAVQARRKGELPQARAGMKGVAAHAAQPRRQPQPPQRAAPGKGRLVHRRHAVGQGEHRQHAAPLERPAADAPDRRRQLHLAQRAATAKGAVAHGRHAVPRAAVVHHAVGHLDHVPHGVVVARHLATARAVARGAVHDAAGLELVARSCRQHGAQQHDQQPCPAPCLRCAQSVLHCFRELAAAQWPGRRLPLREFMYKVRTRGAYILKKAPKKRFPGGHKFKFVESSASPPPSPRCAPAARSGPFPPFARAYIYIRCGGAVQGVRQSKFLKNRRMRGKKMQKN